MLQVVVGVTRLMCGWRILSGAGAPTGPAWAVGALAIGVAAALVIGFMTPIAGMLATIGSIGAALGWIPAQQFQIAESMAAIVYVMCMSAAVVLLGPGAASLDARTFGRREIAIPRPPSG